MSQWTWVLTDNDFVPVGEILNAKSRTVALPLNKLPTASFQLRLDNPLADHLQQAGGYVKAYRDGQLMFYGPTVSVEETINKETQSIAVNAVGAGWLLQKRLAGKSATGTPFASQDRATIVRDLIDAANAEVDTSISTAPLVAAPPAFGQFTASEFVRGATDYGGARISAGSAITYTAGPYRPIMEIVRDLSVGLDGFDWVMVPYDNYTDGAVTTPKIAEFQAFPLYGQDQNEAVFEYGTPGRYNVQEFKRTINRDGQANKVYHLAAPGPDAPGYPVVSAIDAASVSNWNLLEDLAAADLLIEPLRQRLVDEHVRVRSQPRQIIEFTPHIFDPARMPNYGTHYSVGDNVRVRINYNGTLKFDGYIRVWGVSFNVDDLGVERVSITMAEEA
jgi:hypothetical protein